MVWEIRSAGLVCCRTNQGSCLGKDSIREKVACVTHDSFFILLWVPFLIRFVRWMSRLQELLCNWHEHLLGCSALSSAALPMVNINNQWPQFTCWRSGSFIIIIIPFPREVALFWCWCSHYLRHMNDQWRAPLELWRFLERSFQTYTLSVPVIEVWHTCIRNLALHWLWRYQFLKTFWMIRWSSWVFTCRGILFILFILIKLS